MKAKPTRSPRPLLNWVLCRGREILACQVARTGDQYRVSVEQNGRKRRLYVRVFGGSLSAFERHAAIVASLRHEGWTSIAYG
jgi:hypothetical protein